MAGNVRKVSIHKKKVSQRMLFRPDDLFYPLKKYIRLFGHPDQNKKGHTITKVDGVRGLLVILKLSFEPPITNDDADDDDGWMTTTTPTT